MRQATLILGVLLGGSVLLNVVLLARRPEAAAAPAVRPSPASPAEASPGAGSVRDRERIRALEARIRTLEEERAVLAQASTAPAPAVDPLASFRDKLRKLVRLTRDPKASASMTPEQQYEMAEVYMELYRLQLKRARDPQGYAEVLKTAYGIVLEESGSPATPEQAREMSRLLDEHAAALREMSALPALDRFLKEMEREGALNEALMRALTPDQQEHARTQLLSWLNGSMGVQWISRSGAENSLESAWTQAYGLGDSQKPAVQLAARAYLEGIDRLHAEYKGREHLLYDTDGDGRSYRLAAARLLSDALRSLEGAMTAEQREKLRTQAPQELRVMPETSAASGAAQEK